MCSIAAVPIAPMNKGAMSYYEALIQDGHQRNVLDIMQSREEMYDILGYHQYEQKLDQLFSSEES